MRSLGRRACIVNRHVRCLILYELKLGNKYDMLGLGLDQFGMVSGVDMGTVAWLELVGYDDPGSNLICPLA